MKVSVRWLQDLVLAVLVEKEPIKLAPNSAQIPALLAQTKQNIFHLKPHQAPSTQVKVLQTYQSISILP